MSETPEDPKRLFVLDTNVLMHDPTALFRFKEHDIFLPMVVLEELDRGKKGVSEVARNVRQVSRFIDELMSGATHEQIAAGLPLQAESLSESTLAPSGRLFFQTRNLTSRLPDSLPGSTPDNDILATAQALKTEWSDLPVTLVSKDINLRIKAAVIGLHAEDYYNDQVLDDVSLLFSGMTELPADFWETHGTKMDSWQESGRTYYRVTGPLVSEWQPNQFVYREGENPLSAIVLEIDQPNESAVIELVDDYMTPRHSVWGINARNREQNYALNLLMDPEVDFVSLLGAAGTGKTLLALAAGLAQTLEDNTYKEIIIPGSRSLWARTSASCPGPRKRR